MTTSSNTLHIDPLKFTIHDFDLSDCSDSDIDDDDWINISSSSITSTTSTLPSHLVLRPNAQHLGQTSRRTISNGISSSGHSATARLDFTSHNHKDCSSERLASCNLKNGQPSTPTLADNGTIPTPISDPSLLPNGGQGASRETASRLVPSLYSQSAVETLKQHIPNLTAIYLTSPSSLASPSPYPSATDRSDPVLPPHLRTLSSQSPLRLSNSLPYHQRPAGTKMPSLRQPTESYLRICTTCFLPQYRSILVFCDGTWADVTSADTTTTSNVCRVHASTFGGTTLQQWLGSDPCLSPGVTEKSLAEAKSVWNWTNLSQNIDATDKPRRRCTHGPRAACPACPVPNAAPPISTITPGRQGSSKDFLAALIEAVSPFNRDETERDGIRVFDMRSPGSSKGNGLVYVHKEGCECGR